MRRLSSWDKVCASAAAALILSVSTHVAAGDLVPVRIQAQQAVAMPQPSAAPQPVAVQSSRAVPKSLPAAPRTLPAVVVSAQQPIAVPADEPTTEAAIEQFDILSEEELATAPTTPTEISPKLSDATKARMFGWRAEDHYRAGCPLQQRHITMPSKNNRYTLYKVGGGSAIVGTGPAIDEGLWGLDYAGFFPKKLALNWNHGLVEHGGTGAYKTDGPKCKE